MNILRWIRQRGAKELIEVRSLTACSCRKKTSWTLKDKWVTYLGETYSVVIISTPWAFFTLYCSGTKIMESCLTFSVVAFLISPWWHKNNLAYILLKFVLWIGWKRTQKAELKISTGSFQVFQNSATWSCFINMHANGNGVVFRTAPFIYTSFMPVLSCAGLDLILKFNSR